MIATLAHPAHEDIGPLLGESSAPLGADAVAVAGRAEARDHLAGPALVHPAGEQLREVGAARDVWIDAMSERVRRKRCNEVPKR